MFQFEFIQGTISPTARLGSLSKKLITRFPKNKRSRYRKTELSETELHLLREVTIRETSPEAVQKRWELVKKERERSVCPNGQNR